MSQLRTRRRSGPASPKWYMVLVSLVLFFLTATTTASRETQLVKIGVLAYRGHEQARSMWDPTAAYLNAVVPEYSFSVVPLDFHEIGPAVGRGDVDFVLANTSIYVELEAMYGVSRIATLKNRGPAGGNTVFGGVILCRADRNDINDLNDLKGKSFMAVDETSLGGWRVAWRELKAHGIDPYHDFKPLRFGDTHDAVVYAVLNGKVDAGTVRTDTLERLSEVGRIELDTLRVLNPQRVPGFPFALSTRVYPEWPFAKLRRTDDGLAQNVVIALLKLSADSTAARAGNIVGWTVPLDYEPVHTLMKELRLGPYKDYGKITLAGAVRQYWYGIVLGMLALLAMATVTAYVVRLNRHLARAQLQLQQASDTLAQQVQERTAELRLANEGLNREIEEHRQAEAKIIKSEEFNRSILNSVDEGFIVVDRDYRILTANKAYCAQVGKSSDAIIGRPCYEISHKLPRPCHLEGEECAVRSVFENGQPYTVVHRHIVAGGESVFVENKAFPLKDLNNTVVSAIEVINNITERHLLEEERLKTQKLESIGTLAGGIAHDFNNLLQGVLGYISLARINSGRPEQSREALDQAEKALALSVKLTNQLLTFAKGGKPVKRTIDLLPLIESAAKFALSGSRSEYRLAADESLWQVEADEGQIGQVIQNIVLNADQAMPAGGCVEISARNVRGPVDDLPQRDGDQWVQIEIRDSGSGIPQHYLSKIFDPYFTTKEKGSGLGLATSYSIIKNHNGLIEVSSEIGKGTSFVIHLPAAGRVRRESVEVRAPAVVAAPMRSMRILVMDDEPVIRDVAGVLLRSLGHEVASAAHGAEAVEAYREAQRSGTPFHLVILDLTIRGGMGGMATMKKLLEIDPGVNAIVSSGYSDDDAIANFREFGFLAFLKKPYDVEELQAVVSGELIARRTAG